MSYSEPLINQLRVLFLSIGIGALLCMAYVLIQGFFRLFGTGRISYYCADACFMLVFAVVSFFFMVLYNNGRVRLHLIMGEVCGFSVMYFSLGKYVYRMLSRFSCFTAKMLGMLIKPYIMIFRSFISGMREIKNSTAEKINKLRNKEKKEKNKRTKKINLFDKIHLKNSDKSV